MSLDPTRIAAAFRALADAFEETPAGTAAPAATVAPVKRGRGRPVAGETPAPTVPVAAEALVAEPDPFAEPAGAPVPTATIEQVRTALTGLKNATTQDNALAVLKSAGGADNLPSLKPEKYGVVVAAANAATASAKKPAVAVEPDDPFAVPAAPAEKAPTQEELRALIVETQKRTSADTVQKLVMDHGGKAKNASTGVEGPSLQALPVDKYAAVAAALKALPSTK